MGTTGMGTVTHGTGDNGTQYTGYGVLLTYDSTFNMYGGTLGDPDGAVGEDKDGVYIKFADEAKNANIFNAYSYSSSVHGDLFSVQAKLNGNIFNAYGGTVRGVISTTIDQENYNEVGNIKFAGTVFESKVYLGKGSTDAPKQSELSGEGQIVYFYILNTLNTAYAPLYAKQTTEFPRFAGFVLLILPPYRFNVV